jgi:hypothetical protein
VSELLMQSSLIANAVREFYTAKKPHNAPYKNESCFTSRAVVLVFKLLDVCLLPVTKGDLEVAELVSVYSNLCIYITPRLTGDKAYPPPHHSPLSHKASPSL